MNSTQTVLLRANRVATQPREPGKVREFDIWPKNQRISAFYLKLWKSWGIFYNFNAWSDFYVNFKTELLNIMSYIGTLNGLFLIFLSLKFKFYSISFVIETF